MITIFTQKSNGASQKTTQESYDELIERIPFHQLRCTCGRCGDLIRHGYYTRKIKALLSSVILRILRVICKDCGKTHALVPDWLVPYSSILLKDQVQILQAHLSGESMEPIMAEQPVIDESAIGYIIRQFKRHWLPRLTAFQIPLDKNIVPACFRVFGRQLMQIKCTPNLLFC